MQRWSLLVVKEGAKKKVRRLIMKISTLWHFYALVFCSICQQGVSQRFLGFLKQLKDSNIPTNVVTTGVLVTHQIVNKMGAGQVDTHFWEKEDVYF